MNLKNDPFWQEISKYKEFPFFIKFKVYPGSDKNEIMKKINDDEWKIKIKAPPQKNKANLELLKFLKKNYKLEAEIISGQTARQKLLKIKSKKCEK